MLHHSKIQLSRPIGLLLNFRSDESSRKRNVHNINRNTFTLTTQHHDHKRIQSASASPIHLGQRIKVWPGTMRHSPINSSRFTQNFNVFFVLPLRLWHPTKNKNIYSNYTTPRSQRTQTASATPMPLEQRVKVRYDRNETLPQPILHVLPKICGYSFTCSCWPKPKAFWLTRYAHTSPLKNRNHISCDDSTTRPAIVWIGNCMIAIKNATRVALHNFKNRA